MALEHALLVALREHPASGLELARRFERSIGYFWHATHQQIYRTLGRMEADGWLRVEAVAQRGRPDKKVYDVTPAGVEALAAWLATPTPMEPLRSELAVKLRGAAFGDREAVLAVARENLLDHRLRLDHYRRLEKRDHPAPEELTGHALDQWLVLRGGIRLEEFWVGWLEEYLTAHEADLGGRARRDHPDSDIGGRARRDHPDSDIGGRTRRDHPDSEPGGRARRDHPTPLDGRADLGGRPELGDRPEPGGRARRDHPTPLGDRAASTTETTDPTRSEAP